MDIKTRQSKTHYNRIAHHYDESREGKFTLPFNKLLCRCVTLSDNDSVLDVACGNGRLLYMLSQKARIQAYGIDISEKMIEAAKAKNKDADFRVCPADRIEFSDGSFDLLTVCCAFHHFSKPDDFMREACRVLKNNGKLVIAELCPSAVMRWIYNLIIPRMDMGDIKIYNSRSLLAFFKKAGFAHVSCIKEKGKMILQGTKCEKTVNGTPG